MLSPQARWLRKSEPSTVRLIDYGLRITLTCQMMCNSFLYKPK